MDFETNADAPAQRWAVGIDVGGTFTDFVAALPDGSLLHHKEPSTPGDQSLAVERGLRVLRDMGVDIAGSAGLVVHGTTIGLNAVLQRKGARIALIVSRGTRDMLEIGPGRLPHYLDFLASRPEPLVSRDRVLEIAARLDRKGAVTIAPDEQEIDRVCAEIAALGVDAVAIVLLNSYVDRSLEDRLAAAIRARLPGMLVTSSAEIWPEIREYERAVVACLNAQIHPLMDAYLSTLEGRILGVGARSVLQLTTSAGGTLSPHSARARPVETLFSGPASGVVAAARLASEAGIPSAVTFDMGGTSADIAVLAEGEIEFTTTAWIADVPLMMPVIGVSSIGAGGGSMLGIDEAGVLKVGPESAGSNPGPVAYGLGGVRPTVTDCYLVAGMIDPANFLGGRIKLDKAASEAALQDIAQRLGLASAAHAAEAALRVTTARMATELFNLMAKSGHDPSGHVIMPFGGAGPTHAVLLAEEAGLSGVAVPPAAATFCALGAVVADVRRDFLRSLGSVGWADLPRRVWPSWAELEAEAQDWLAREGTLLVGHRLEYALDMRYKGQQHNLLIRIPPEVRAAEDMHGVAEAFHEAHERLYEFREGDEIVEVVSVRLSIIGEVPPIALPRLARGGREATPLRRRAVFHQGGWRDADVYQRSALQAGDFLEGPAIVEQDDTTTWVPPGWRLETDVTGILSIRRSDAHAA